MYARVNGMGVGGAILEYLENKARGFGYSALRLETGVQNGGAVAFYERSGYKRIQGFGKYAGRDNSACFEKRL